MLSQNSFFNSHPKTDAYLSCAQVTNFKTYVDMYLKDKVDDNGSPLKVAYEVVNDRWEVCLTTSEKGFQQVSFVNSIATTKVSDCPRPSINVLLTFWRDLLSPSTTGTQGRCLPRSPFGGSNCLYGNRVNPTKPKMRRTLHNKHGGTFRLPRRDIDSRNGANQDYFDDNVG